MSIVNVNLIALTEVADRLQITKPTAVYLAQRGDLGPIYTITGDKLGRRYVESELVHALAASDAWRRPRGRKKNSPEEGA